MKHATWIVTLFAALFFSTSVSAQILNIERLRLEKDSARAFQMKTTAGLNVFNRSAAADAPVNLLGYNFNVNALYYPGKHAFMGVSTFDYLRINDNDFLNFGFVHLRANFLRENRVNYETFGQYSYDNFRGLFPRLVAGGAIRFRLLKSKTQSLILGIGGFLEDETWMHPVSGETVQVTFAKSSNYLAYRTTLGTHLDINTINYYQTTYDAAIGAFRNRWSSMTVINSRISKHFSLTNTFEIHYEDRPIVPITRLIFAIRTGISVDL
jgi:hypothetical protein